jgi:hypothetical protein
VLGGSGALADRLQAHRVRDEISAERLEECIHAFSSALRDRVRADYPLPEGEVVEYEVVTNKPWSGFNYYLGGYRSRVAVNADLRLQMSNLPRAASAQARGYFTPTVQGTVPHRLRTFCGRTPQVPARLVIPLAWRADQFVKAVTRLASPRRGNIHSRRGNMQ